jgi:hypothetical protein
VQPSSANVLGSYEWMVDTYGDPSYLGVNDGPLRDKLAEVLQKREVEQKNAAEFDTSLEKIGTSWATFLRNNPGLDPEADSTYEVFQRDAPIDLSIIPGAGSAFMQNIEAVAKNPEAHPDFFSDIDARDKTSNEEQKRYEELLKGVGSVLDVDGSPGGNEAEDESMRAFLAAWVRRDDVKWWAEKNGFELGKAEPIDPESDFGKEVAAGRVPGQMIVNGMLYRQRPDDIRAFRLAHAQVEQDPEDSIFRALGLAHKTGPRRIVEVEEIVEPGKPVKLVKQGLHENGVVALDSEGNFHWSTDDGKTWSAIDKGAGQNMMVEAEAADLVDTTPVDLPGATSKPVTRTRQLEYREPIYKRDAPNSVRGVDPATGEEVYIPPEKVAKQTFPGGAPAKGATLVDRINQVSAKRTMKKAGEQGFELTPEMNETAPGPAPTPAQKKETKAAAEQMRAPTPDLAALPEEKPGSDEEPVKPPSFDRYAPRKGYAETIREKAKAFLPGAPQPHTIGGGTPPKPPGAVIGGGTEATGTTTSTTTTPTVSTVTEAQRKALEESRKRQKKTEVEKQAAGAGASPGAAL